MCKQVIKIRRKFGIAITRALSATTSLLSGMAAAVDIDAVQIRDYTRMLPNHLKDVDLQLAIISEEVCRCLRERERERKRWEEGEERDFLEKVKRKHSRLAKLYKVWQCHTARVGEKAKRNTLLDYFAKFRKSTCSRVHYFCRAQAISH